MRPDEPEEAAWRVTIDTETPDPAELEELRAALAAREPELRLAAAEALLTFRADLPEALAVILEELRGNSELSNQMAADLLVGMGASALPALVEALADDKVAVRRAAVHAIGELGPAAESAMPGLISALDDSDSEVRAESARSIARVGRAARSAGPALAAHAGDESALVRYAIAAALVSLGTEATAAVSALVEGLADHNAMVRRSAAEALRALGEPAQAAIPDLEKALGDEDPEVRIAVIHALGHQGRRDAACFAVICAISEDESELDPVREAAAWALEQMA